MKYLGKEIHHTWTAYGADGVAEVKVVLKATKSTPPVLEVVDSAGARTLEHFQIEEAVRDAGYVLAHEEDLVHLFDQLTGYVSKMRESDLAELFERCLGADQTPDKIKNHKVR